MKGNSHSQSHLIQTFPFCKALSLQLQLIVSSALRYNKFLTDGASSIRSVVNDDIAHKADVVDDNDLVNDDVDDHDGSSVC